MVAVRLLQPYHCVPHLQEKVPCPEKEASLFFAPCGAWGCLIAIFIRVFPTS